MALTKPPLDMIQATGTAGEVLTVGSNNGVSTSSAASTTSPYPVSGGFNDINGTLTLKMSDNTTVSIAGLPTSSSAGKGATGLPGSNGVNGVPGRDGTNGTNGKKVRSWNTVTPQSTQMTHWQKRHTTTPGTTVTSTTQ